MKDTLAHDLELAKLRPSVPGEAVEHIYLPAKGFMKGRLIKRGQVIRIIDLEGQQVFDSIIWDANNLNNVLNCCMSMIYNEKWDKWRSGDVIYSKNSDKLAMITEDTTDGTHAFAGAFCNEALWRVRDEIPGVINCLDNLVSAMTDYGFSADDIDWGSCVSFFMDYPYLPNGKWEMRECHNKPGDYIDLMAEMDIIIAISNCPAENICNAYKATPMQAVIFNPDKDYKAKVNSLRK